MTLDPVVRTVVASDNLVTDFDLHATVTPIDISGNWTMTLTASAACRQSLPEAFRERKFDVVISQQATRARLRLISSTLDESDGEWFFDGRPTDRVLRMDLPRGRPLFDWLLLEYLGGNRFLAISGAIAATLGAADMVGTLDGDIVLYQTQAGPTLEVAACRDSGHSLVLRRR